MIIHTYNLEQFYAEKEIAYYLLGAWVTDGCVYKYKNRPNKKSVTLTSKDYDWLEIINAYISADKPILKHGPNCYRLMYNSTELADWFISHGCGERKSLSLEFPKVPDEYMPDFIRGCWDGDGCLSFSKCKNGNWQYQANLTNGSFVFCNSMVDILNSHDIKSKVYNHGGKRKIEGRELNSSCWRVVLSGGGSVYNLLNWAYKDNSISMPRKNLLAHKIMNYRDTVQNL